MCLCVCVWGGGGGGGVRVLVRWSVRVCVQSAMHDHLSLPPLHLYVSRTKTQSSVLL